MQKTTQNLIVTTTAVLLFCMGAQSAFAGVIDVAFQTNPLFGEANFLPGDTVTRTVTVTNTDSVAHDVYTEVVNVTDGGLGDVIDVVVSDGGLLFMGSFSDFAAAHQVFLSHLDASASVVYSFAMTFRPDAGNSYGDTSLGFDFCVGFSGGPFNCDGTTDNPPGGGGGGTTTQTFGGGGGGGHISLTENQPVGEVLGEQTSIIPVGAPNTGFGRMTDNDSMKIVFGLLVLLYIEGIRRSLRTVYGR